MLRTSLSSVFIAAASTKSTSANMHYVKLAEVLFENICGYVY